GGHVVHRREVEEVVDPLALELGDLLVADAELGLREIAEHGLDTALGLGSPALDELLEPLRRALAHEHVDVAIALEQLLDEVTADEARRAGDEVGHAFSLV